jgi:crotonobetainyl-CoA:carnitine CoA-transferase CaiB-like acyl-CoA transferase
MGAPVVGQHTSEILAEIGIPDTQIKDLMTSGVIVEEHV